MFDNEATYGNILDNIKDLLQNEKGMELCDVYHATRYLTHLNLREDREKRMNFLTCAPSVYTMSKKKSQL